MFELEFGNRTLGIILQPTDEGSKLFREVASAVTIIRRPFARSHKNPVLRNLIYAEGPDEKIKILRESIKKHPGLKEINYETVERRRR